MNSINLSNDSWESRIEQFTSVVGLTTEQVEQALAQNPFELTKETPYVLEMLSDETVTPFGDFRKIFSDNTNYKISLPKLRMGIKFLRGPKEKREDASSKIDPDLLKLQTMFGIKTQMSDLEPEQLIPYYNPTKQNIISETLKDKFGSKKVIAFYPSSKKVAVEDTINYIVDLQNGLPEENTIEVDGELVRLYPVGKVPNQTVDEDPMFHNQPLKRERSIINRINWDGISKPLRQISRIIIDTNEINPNDKIHVRLLMNDIREGMETVKKSFPEAYLKFREMQERNELPKLEISVNDVETKQNNPFGINRTY